VLLSVSIVDPIAVLLIGSRRKLHASRGKNTMVQPVTTRDRLRVERALEYIRGLTPTHVRKTRQRPNEPLLSAQQISDLHHAIDATTKQLRLTTRSPYAQLEFVEQVRGLPVYAELRWYANAAQGWEQYDSAWKTVGAAARVLVECVRRCESELHDRLYRRGDAVFATPVVRTTPSLAPYAI